MRKTASATALMLALAAHAAALPQGGQVVAGGGAISQPDAATTTVTQSTGKAILDWTAFNVGVGESVLFSVPDASSITLNRVTGGTASQIYGNLSSNGQLWLVNPQGVVFGNGAQVNVGSLLATTGSLADSAFMNGQYGFGNATGAVTNNGTLAAAPGGYILLAAPTVANNGTINAPQGQIGLAGATGFTVDPVGDNLLTYAPDPAQFALNVANAGTLSAPGGRISLATQAADAALASVVNAGGIIEANGFQNVNSHIVLGGAGTQLTKVTGQVSANGASGNAGSVKVVGEFVDVKTGATISADGGANGNGGTVDVIAGKGAYMSGNISARGGSASGNGGNVEVSGHRNLSLRGNVDTSAPHGQLGMLLLDPTNIVIADGTGGANDAELSDDQILAADGGGGDFFISEQALEAIAGTSNIRLEATNSITLNNLSDDLLNLKASTGTVTFRADSDNDGVGDFTATAADTIATAGGALFITGANLYLGNIDTSAGTGGITLSTTGGGNINLLGNLRGGSAGGVTLNGLAVLQTDLAITSAGGPITFAGGATGPYAATLNAGTGAVTLGGGVNIKSFALAAGNTTLGGAITTTGAQDYTNGGAVTLAANTTLTASNAGTRQNIIFGAANTINGARTLAINGAGVTLGGAVGGSTPLAGLTVDATTGTSTRNVTVAGTQTYTGGLTTNGTLKSTSGNVNTGAVTLAGATTLQADAGNVTTGNINGTQALAVTAGGTASMGAVGGTARAASLALTTTGGATLGNVATTGAQTYTGPVSLGGTYQTTTGGVTFNNAATLAGATTIDTALANANATFNGAVDGAQALTVKTGTGQAVFNGAVGGSTPLASVAVTGKTTLGNSVATTGAQTYSGAVTLGADATLATANTDITLGAVTGAHALTLSAGGGDLYLSAVTVDTLTLASADDLFQGGDVTTQSALDFTSIDDIVLLANSAFTAGPSSGRQNITMNAGNQLSGAFNLALTGNTIALGTVNGVRRLTLTATAGNLIANPVATTGAVTVNGPATLGATIATAGNRATFNGPVTLSADSTVNTAGGIISFADTVNGAHALTLNSGAAATTLSGALGGTTPLTALDVTSGLFTSHGIALAGNLSTHGPAVFNGLTTANAIALAGDSTINANMAALGDLSANGNTTLGANLSAGANLGLTGDLLLSADSTIANGGGAPDAFTLTGNISGPHTLTLAGGGSNIAMTGNTDVGTLTFASGNNLLYGGGTLKAASGLNFTPLNQILLSGDTSLVGGNGATTRANVTAGLSNSVLATSSGVNLYVFGDTVTMGQIGDSGTGRLGSLTIDANIASLLGSIYTTGAQTINAQQGLAGFLTSNGGDIILNTTANLVGDINAVSNGGDIYINQPLNGHYAMRLDAATGRVFINAALGNTERLTTMDIIGSIIAINAPISTTGDQNYLGPTLLNTALTLTLGNITYHDAVTLAGATALDTSGGNGAITFEKAVDGGADLTLSAGPGGQITFADAAGATTRLGTLTVASAHDITFTKGVYATNYYQSQIEGLASFGFNPGLNVTHNIVVGVSHDLVGKFTGTDILLTAGGSITGEAYAGRSLTLNSHRTLLTGSVRGQPGRGGARLVTFQSFMGGPHYFGGQNLPVVDDFYALPSLAAKWFAAPGSPSGQPLSLPDDDALNPFSAVPPLLVADNALRGQGMADVLAPVFPSGF